MLGAGNMTPYYSMSSLNSDEAIKPVYDLFMESHKTSNDALKEVYDGESFNPNHLRINIMLL